MSIINDALKKAQKRHAQGQAPLPPPVPGGGAPGGPVRRPGQPMPSQLFVLFALGAIVLVALSVLATVYLLRRPAAAGPVVAQAAAPAPVEKPAPPAVVKPARPPAPPVIAPAASAPTPLPPAPAAPSAPPPAIASAAPPAAVAPPATIAPPAVAFSVPPPLDPTKPDPKILAFVDALQVAGVRITSSGGKVLMNDRVYRENDTVDRLLGLRLKKIEEDTLIFVDERGVTYTKNF